MNAILKPSDFAAYQARVENEPIWFAQQILNHRALPGEPTLAEDAQRSWELDTFQHEVLEACADVRRKYLGRPTRVNHKGKKQITIVAGQGPGKTHTAALCAHWFGQAFPAVIFTTGPKYKQVLTRFFPAFRRIAMRAPPWYRAQFKIDASQVIWHRDRDWCLRAETAAKPDNMGGSHPPFQLIIVDEASGVTELLWPVVFGSMSTGVLQILLVIGNGLRRTGTFADSHLREAERDHWYAMQVGLKNSARMDRAWANRLITKYGVNSPVVRARVFGEFPTDDPRQLIALIWLAAARSREFHPDGSHPKRRISIDVADGGECETVVTLAEHYQSFRRGIKQRVFSHPASEAPILAADEGERMWKDFGLDRANGDDFVVDSIGVGAGTAGTLMRRGYPVVRFVAGAKSANPALWRDRRTQASLVARNDLRDGLVVFDEDFVESHEEWDDFDSQSCSIKTRDNGDKIEELEPKKQLVDDGFKSPDRWDSWMMQYATTAPAIVQGAQGTKRSEVLTIPSTAEVEAPY